MQQGGPYPGKVGSEGRYEPVRYWMRLGIFPDPGSKKIQNPWRWDHVKFRAGEEVPGAYRAGTSGRLSGGETAGLPGSAEIGHDVRQGSQCWYA